MKQQLKEPGKVHQILDKRYTPFINGNWKNDQISKYLQEQDLEKVLEGWYKERLFWTMWIENDIEFSNLFRISNLNYLHTSKNLSANISMYHEAWKRAIWL